jgi:hypothetical protein
MESDPAARLSKKLHVMRLLLFALFVAIAYPNIRLALEMGRLSEDYKDGAIRGPIPPGTAVVVHMHFMLIGLSVAIALLGVASLFFRRRGSSIYFLGVLIVLVLAQMAWTLHMVPLPTDIIVPRSTTGP